MTEALLPAMQPLVDRQLEFLAGDGATDAEFDELALAQFAFQYAHNEPYRRFCQRRGMTPRRVNGWREVPPVPISEDPACQNSALVSMWKILGQVAVAEQARSTPSMRPVFGSVRLA